MFGQFDQGCPYMRRSLFGFKLGKVPFIVYGGVVLGQVVSKRVIEVDKAKIEVIERLPPPTCVKGV